MNILLVEDDLIDAKAFIRAVDNSGLGAEVTLARDGVEAWQLLGGPPGERQRSVPDIVVLDINLPRMSGLELLRRIRSHEELQDIVVIVLSTSDNDRDQVEAAQLTVTAYLLKSDMTQGYTSAIELLDRYQQLITLPLFRIPGQ